MTKQHCHSCGQTIPDWLKENELIARGCKIIGVKRGKNGKLDFVYYEPIMEGNI